MLVNLQMSRSAGHSGFGTGPLGSAHETKRTQYGGALRPRSSTSANPKVLWICVQPDVLSQLSYCVARTSPHISPKICLDAFRDIFQLEHMASPHMSLLEGRREGPITQTLSLFQQNTQPHLVAAHMTIYEGALRPRSSLDANLKVFVLRFGMSE